MKLVHKMSFSKIGSHPPALILLSFAEFADCSIFDARFVTVRRFFVFVTSQLRAKQS